MQQIIYFLKKFRYFLLFLSLEIFALVLTIQQHSFHSSKFFNSSNAVSGFFLEKKSTISEFFLLRKENERLNQENVHLKNKLINAKIAIDTTFQLKADSVTYFQQYNFTAVKIINNDYRKRNNYLTINKGTNHGLSPDLGVVNSQGIIGVVKSVSSNFATVLSVLNMNSRINVRLMNSDHFGTMIWNGDDYRTVQIVDIPRQAVLKEGDTLISGGRSAMFPEGIPIGTIADFTLRNNQYDVINVTLFNDMSAIGHAQVIKNLLKEEQLDLERNTEQNE